ncbi:MAG: LarC family nickel insertion protein [Alphaproteobacteria bacterium]|nr:LarC family nickel insertion protein [Alphaproteobacteria bacterium]
MHIHLDPVGGIAGDMFVAAMLDAWPEHRPAVDAGLARLGAPAGVAARAEVFGDGILTGTRFVVSEPPAAHHHAHGLHGHEHHPHRTFREIRSLLQTSGLSGPVATHALGIFGELAVAEGKVHGVSPDDVTFHEIGAWDSIIDIVAAAIVLDRVGAASWSVAALPIGSGRVKTAHGELPVPPPAVVLLLEGFPVYDDGRPGERVTPTGAAILRHLAPGYAAPSAVMRIGRVGHGFGTKRFAGLSNVLRLRTLEAGEASGERDEVAVLRFEVDDQAPEDLAVGLDRLRAEPGILDVVQAPVFGKKGRMAIQVQVLVRVDAIEQAAARCLAETTTLGVRLERVERRIVARREAAVPDGGTTTARVKIATRPDGAATVKAEMDDIAAGGGDRATRERKRRRVEAVVRRQLGDIDG